MSEKDDNMKDATSSNGIEKRCCSADEDDKEMNHMETENNMNNNSTEPNESEKNNESEKDKQIESPKKIASSSSVKSSYSLSMKPTLPNILSNYGLQEELKPKENKKRKKKKKLKFFNEDDDRELIRQRERDEERHLQVVDDVEKLYKYIYAEYMNKLQSHVVKQRQQIEKKTALMENRMREQMERESREKKLARERKMQRHNFSSNTEFLKNIPKTDLGRIVQLMDKMMKEGQLRTKTDLDDFWVKIQKPEVFQTYFKIPRATDSYGSMTDMTRSVDYSQESVVEDAFENKQTMDMARALSQITENSKESSRPCTSEWAVTQQVKHQHTGTDSAFTRRGSASQIAKQAATDLDKRCPRLEMPKLSCFLMDLSKKGPDADELLHRSKLRAREYERKMYIKKLQKMHQMAMAHSAAANRILASHADELSLALEGSNLHDVFMQAEPEEKEEFYIRDGYTGEPIFFTEASGDYSVASSKCGDATGDYVRKGSADDFGAEKRSVQSASTVVSRKSKSSTSSKVSSVKDKTHLKSLSRPTSSHKLPQIPLTWNEMQENSKTKEARCLSTNWTNYMNVGKSIFAPS